MKKTQKRRVLVVDDQQVVRDILAHFLSIKGFDVETAENGLEALALFIVDHFDIVITDLQMPHMDGSSLALEIKNRNPTTFIIIMTGDREADVKKLLASGCADFAMLKPFSLNTLYDVCQFAFASKAENRSQQAASS